MTKITPLTKLIGVDTGSKDGDYTCKVYGKKLKNGTLKIIKVKYLKPKK